MRTGENIPLNYLNQLLYCEFVSIFGVISLTYPVNVYIILFIMDYYYNYQLPSHIFNEYINTQYIFIYFRTYDISVLNENN